MTNKPSIIQNHHCQTNVFLLPAPTADADAARTLGGGGVPGRVLGPAAQLHVGRPVRELRRRRGLQTPTLSHRLNECDTVTPAPPGPALARLAPLPDVRGGLSALRFLHPYQIQRLAGPM